jgi:hypothetical protein
MNIKLTALVLALLIAGLGAVACNKTETSNTGNANNTNNGNSANANTKTAEKPTMKTPQGTFNVAYNALKAGDMDGFKKTISKDYMKQLEQIASLEKRSVDDVIKEALTKHPIPPNPEMKPPVEQDDGSLKIQFKDANNQPLTTYMIKEGDDWKFTFGPESNLIEEQATGSGKEGSDKDIKDAKEQKGRGK